MGLLDALFSGQQGGGLLDFLRNNAMNQQPMGGLPSDQAQYGSSPMQAYTQQPVPQQPPPVIQAQNGTPPAPPMQPPMQNGTPPSSMQLPMQPAPQAPGGLGAGINGFISNLHTGPLGAIVGGVGSAMGMQDPTTQLKAQHANLTAQALRSKGIPEDAIAAAVGNGRIPGDQEFLKTLIARAYPTEDKSPTSVQEYKYYKDNLPDGQKPMPYDAWSTAKSRAAATNVTTNVNNPTVENARDKAIGEVIGKEVIGKDIQAGANASNTLRTLSTLAEANKQGGDDISSGPFGKAVLSGKQALSELTGSELKGLPESEVTQKVGFDLATKMVKAITNRPSQMEFGKALENVPSIYMSKPGRTAMISILSQQAQADREIGRLANKRENWENYQDVKDKYYETHPLISPFTGKPFGESDIQMITNAAPKNDAAAIDRSAIEAEMRRRGLMK